MDIQIQIFSLIPWMTIQCLSVRGGPGSGPAPHGLAAPPRPAPDRRPPSRRRESSGKNVAHWIKFHIFTVTQQYPA